MRTTLFSAFLLMLFITPAVSAKAAEPLKPASPWNVNYANSSCELKRVFGTGDDEILFTYSQSGSFEGGELFLIHKGRDENSEHTEFTLSPAVTANDIDMKQRQGSVYNSADSGFIVWRVYGILNELLLEADKQSLLILKPKSREPAKLAIDNMKQALTAMDKCQKQLFQSFGLDYAEISALKTTPIARNQKAWAVLAQQSFPLEAMRKGQQGTVRVMLVIDIEGKPKDCKILSSSGYDILDEAACNVLNKKRPRFWPARDSDGNAVEAPYLTAIRYTM